MHTPNLNMYTAIHIYSTEPNQSKPHPGHTHTHTHTHTRTQHNTHIHSHKHTYKKTDTLTHRPTNRDTHKPVFKNYEDHTHTCTPTNLSSTRGCGFKDLGLHVGGQRGIDGKHNQLFDLSPQLSCSLLVTKANIINHRTQIGLQQ